MHRCLVHTTLIMHPCGLQIHNHRQEHVLIDLTVTVQKQQSKKGYEGYEEIIAVCVRRD